MQCGVSAHAIRGSLSLSNAPHPMLWRRIYSPFSAFVAEAWTWVRWFTDSTVAVAGHFTFFELEVEAEEADVRIHFAELVEFAVFKPADAGILWCLLCHEPILASPTSRMLLGARLLNHASLSTSINTGCLYEYLSWTLQ